MLNQLDKSTILIVDDTPDILSLLSKLLKGFYNVKVANNGKKALEILDKYPIDLVLLDIVMPEMDGYEVLENIRHNPKLSDLPVIFLTGENSVKAEEKGLSLGANDYITKPPSPVILKARVKTQLENKIFEDFLKDQNHTLDEIVDKKTKEVVAIQNVTMMALGSLAETRDSDTGNHIRRTQKYVKLLAEKLQSNKKFTPYLTQKKIETIYKSAPLHDIGKVGIPDKILLKPGHLDDEEFQIMKTHAQLGKDAIEKAEQELGQEVDFLQTAKDIAQYHHEKYDGTGYPMGLKEDDIPISARIMAIADVYDALISNRIYKDAFSHDIAVDIIIQGSGTHFDPDMVDAFKELEQNFKEIAIEFCD